MASAVGPDSWSDLQSHELLDEQLASIRDVHLAYLRGVAAVLAFESLLSKVAYTHEAADFTKVDFVQVTHIKESLFKESSCSMRDHAVTFHLTKAKTAISRSAFSRLASENLSGASTSRVDLIIDHMLESLIVGRA